MQDTPAPREQPRKPTPQGRPLSEASADSSARGEDRVGLQLLKLGVEIGPLLVFFIANARFDIFVGTAAFMVATVISLAASRRLFGRVPVLPLVSGVFVIIFGGLTLWLHDELFIKLKPTIVNSIFGTILLAGLGLRMSLLKYLFDDSFHLTEEGWRKLTFRWGLFFFVLAAINEVVWRNFSTDFWIAFKGWGIVPITLVFGLAQVGLIKRYSTDSVVSDKG